MISKEIFLARISKGSYTFSMNQSSQSSRELHKQERESSPLLGRVPIASPPWTSLGKKLESQCRKAIYEFQLLEGISKVAVALSGGKDSLALLYLLHAISGRGVQKLDLYAIHIEGEFSCGAMVGGNFLEGICRELSIPLIRRQSTQKRESLSCYRCSRERRSLLFSAAKEVGAHTIAFGHHRDDNAQTLLMNLLHKAEFAAMLPKLSMIDYGVTIIRPLIYAKESDIRTFAQQYGFARLSCQCPVGQSSLRKESDLLLQQLERIFPNARENLASAGLLYGSTKATRR